MSSPAANRLLRLPQVRERTGLSRSTVYLLESQARFPGRVKVGARAVAWPKDEVQAWIDAKKATRCVSTDQETAQTVSRALASTVDVVVRTELPLSHGPSLHTCAERVDHTHRLVSRNSRPSDRKRALNRPCVGMANAAGLDAYSDIARLRIDQRLAD